MRPQSLSSEWTQRIDQGFSYKSNKVLFLTQSQLEELSEFISDDLSQIKVITYGKRVLLM